MDRRMNVLALCATVFLGVTCSKDSTGIKTPPVGIGPNGGVDTLAAGLIILNVPAGAVTQYTSFTATSASGPANPLLVTGSVWQISPQVSFPPAAEPTVTVQLTGLTMPSGVLQPEVRVGKVVSSSWAYLTSANTGSAVSTTLGATGTFGLLGVPVAAVRASQGVLTMSVGDTLRLTAVAQDADSNNLPNRPISWSATNGSIATVSGSGLVTAVAVGSASIITSSAAIADTIPVSVSTASTTPWLVEDFSTYTSLANMMLDPRGIYDHSDINNLQQVSLINSGVNGLTQSMRYTWPIRTDSANRCTDYYITRSINTPDYTASMSLVPEMWAEIWVRFSSSFTTKAPAAWSCTSDPDYKFIFIRVVGGGRFDLKNDYAGEGTHWDANYPGGGDGDNNFIYNVWHDDQWHRIRMHARVSTTATSADGIWDIWLDDSLVTTRHTLNTVFNGTLSTGIYGVKMGANLNQGPAAVQTLDWGLIKLWKTNPGW